MNPSSEKQYHQNFANLLRDLGENPDREGLLKTPSRWLDSMKFLTSGYKLDMKKLINDAVFNEGGEDMVIVRDIEVYSVCEHHVLPFFGTCHVGYIPRGKVVGLSKIPRIVDAFCRRLQVQERLTHDISKALEEALNPQGVGVVVEAYHMCMMMRGVEKQRSYTVTSSMRGVFSKMETRSEFLSLINSPKQHRF